MTNTPPFPNNLRSLRTQAGLLQADVAKALGLASTDRISHWEKGQAVPSIINLFKLSALYKVSPEELYPELFKMMATQTAGT
jgi:transcriptional regulator with XRE-family HTH domain